MHRDVSLVDVFCGSHRLQGSSALVLFWGLLLQYFGRWLFALGVAEPLQVAAVKGASPWLLCW